MAVYRILIVDDHRDIRRVLRTALDTLGVDLDIIDVPSGEEAILVLSRHPIDLLITDIHLPGISGLELKERSEVRNPNLKLIIITGLTEPRIRRQVANSGVDAFFFKPLEIDEFLDTVRHLMGLHKPELPEQPSDVGEEDSDQTLSERLTKLRDEVKALSAALLDESGEILVQTGVLPEEASSKTMLSALATTCGTALKVSRLLGEASFRELMFFSGRIYNFVATNVGESMVLLLVTEGVSWNDSMLAKWLAAIRPAVQDLLTILSNIGVSVEEDQEEEAVIDLEQDMEADIDIPEDLPELDALFEKADQDFKPEDVDAFWDTLVDDESQPEQITRTDAISYEQAQQLGLTPEDE